MKTLLKNAVRAFGADSRVSLLSVLYFDKHSNAPSSHLPNKFSDTPEGTRCHFIRCMKSFASNTNGNLMTTACFVMPLTALVSMALLELSFAYRTEAKMQTALDASILAASVQANRLPAQQSEADR